MTFKHYNYLLLSIFSLIITPYVHTSGVKGRDPYFAYLSEDLSKDFIAALSSGNIRKLNRLLPNPNIKKALERDHYRVSIPKKGSDFFVLVDIAIENLQPDSLTWLQSRGHLRRFAQAVNGLHLLASTKISTPEQQEAANKICNILTKYKHEDGRNALKGRNDIMHFPLHTAARCKNVPMIHLLAQAGADVNQPHDDYSPKHSTPLEIACLWYPAKEGEATLTDYRNTIAALLQRGATIPDTLLGELEEKKARCTKDTHAKKIYDMAIALLTAHKSAESDSKRFKAGV